MNVSTKYQAASKVKHSLSRLSTDDSQKELPFTFSQAIPTPFSF